MKGSKIKRILLSILAASAAVLLAATIVYRLFPATRTTLGWVITFIIWAYLVSSLTFFLDHLQRRRQGRPSRMEEWEQAYRKRQEELAQKQQEAQERKQREEQARKQEEQKRALENAWEERQKAARAQIEREREEKRRAQEELQWKQKEAAAEKAQEKQSTTREEPKEEVQDRQKKLERMCREQNALMRPFLPPELAGRIPAKSDVMIERCGLPWSAPEGAGPFPKDVIFSEKDGPYVRYGYIGERHLQKFRKERFAEAFHPFIEASAPANVGHCAEQLSHYIPARPDVFTLFRDRLEIGCFSKDYSESADSIQVYGGETYSYHDGGGGSSEVWTVRRAPGMTPPKELRHEERPMSRIAMPSCKGYWLKNDRCYLLEPWDMPGVFEFYSCDRYQASYDSEEKVQQIGTPFDESAQRTSEKKETI